MTCITNKLPSSDVLSSSSSLILIDTLTLNEYKIDETKILAT